MIILLYLPQWSTGVYFDGQVQRRKESDVGIQRLGAVIARNVVTWQSSDINKKAPPGAFY